MRIIEEYRSLTEDIAVIKSKIQTARRKLDKLIDTYKPKEVTGIDYSQDRVQTNSSPREVMEVANDIVKVNVDVSMLEGVLRGLYRQRGELEKTINELGDIKKKIMMLQIKGFRQWQIARELNYSKRHIERLCYEIKEEMKGEENETDI